MDSQDDSDILGARASRRSSASSTSSRTSQRHSTIGQPLRTGRSTPNLLNVRTQGIDMNNSSTVLPPIGRTSPDSNNVSTMSSPPPIPEPYTFVLVSNSRLDRAPGDGEAYPKIVRNFRREVSSDGIELTSQTDFHSPRPDTASCRSADSLRAKRSVSFSKEHRMMDGEDGTSGLTRLTYDGREIALVSFETQTDWDWLEEAVLEENVKIIKPSGRSSPISDNKDSDIKSTSSLEKPPAPQPKVKKVPVKKKEEESPIPYPYNNDEYGIPMLDLSSDTDDSSDEDVAMNSAHNSDDDDNLLPSIGPPQILQYIRESDRDDLEVDDPEIGQYMDQTDFPMDDFGQVQGMFSGECEFCHGHIKPFPTAEQQQECQPEELYCCEEYRQFVEATVLSNEKPSPASMINVKPHTHFGSKQARKMAKDKAQQRMREREMVRLHQQQHSTGGHGNTSGGQRSSKPSIHGVEGRTVTSYKDMDQKGSVPLVTTGPDGAEGDVPSQREPVMDRQERDSQQAPVTSTAREPSRPAPSIEESSVAESVSRHSKSQKTTLPAMPTSLTSSKESDLDNVPQKREKKSTSEGRAVVLKKRLMPTSDRDVARQMKTINYQLSSVKCLEEGWTVRPPSPMLEDDGDDVFIPEPLDPAFVGKGKHRNKSLIQKLYEDGQPFLTIFADGTGNVYYPSGRVAVLIVSKEPGHYIYLVHDDSQEPEILAVFCSSGQASCCHMNGQLRLFLDQYGGIELDVDGGKKKKWLWKDNETHVHAPPFQPVCFGLTAHIAIRVMTQENISLTFRCKSRSCRFPVGAKLKLVAPENIPPKEIDEGQLFINETKAYVESVLNKVSNLLRFPKSPKLEKMLPPLHITSKIQKNEKLRQEQVAMQAAVQAKAQRQKHRPIVVVK